jgi:hypothetical protein
VAPIDLRLAIDTKLDRYSTSSSVNAQHPFSPHHGVSRRNEEHRHNRSPFSPHNRQQSLTKRPGGGIIGSTTAYFLSHHPKFNPATHTITLLEATKIAGGASGRAGGLLALWAYPSCIVRLSYRLHKEVGF